MKYTEYMLFQYINTALWSSIDAQDEPLDEDYHYHDVDLSVIERAKKDITEFCETAGELLDGLDDSQVAHDLWLTRNRHGAGFWDRGLGEVGEQLTKIAHDMGEVCLCVGNDEKIKCKLCDWSELKKEQKGSFKVHNIDNKTGIRYSVINANDDNLFDWLYDEIQDEYQALCEHCDAEIDNDVSVCPHCEREIVNCNWSEEPIKRCIEDDNLFVTVTEVMELFVIESKYKCYRGLCSPCAPNACHQKTAGEYECYCLQPNWYKIVPFDIYDLAGNLVAKKGTENDE